MNKITSPTRKNALIKASLFCLSLLFFQLNVFSQNGEDIFNANCTACHFATADRLVGPGLAGVNDRHSREWLIEWVKDSKKMVDAGDAEAVALFEEYQVDMQSFGDVLSVDEINAVFDFLAKPVEASSDDESAGDTEAGKKLFKANCAACHDLGTKTVVGPGLQGVNDKYSREWLGEWITNSAELIASGDADANAIFNEFKKVPMPPQPVSDEEIDAILAYIANPGTEEAGGSEISETGGAVVKEDNSKLKYIFGAVILLLIVLIITLNKTGVFMREMKAKDEGVEYDGPTTLWGSFMELLGNNKGIVAAVVIVLFFGGLVSLMDGAFQIGVHQGYKPEQPIKFSHKIHAGDDEIDCNYCHSSARHSKTSGIPSLNVCMNCHKYIDGSDGKTFMYNGAEYSMTEEIQKIYDHLDYNPSTQEYGDNPTPVRWIKVHNLPDHVYYSHEQHVTAGKQKCQTCHGPVEEMAVVEQHSPLTMKWCIKCHQETAVSTEGNGYYEDMHSRMTDEYKEKVLGDGVLTVDEIGGWECAKCHY